MNHDVPKPASHFRYLLTITERLRCLDSYEAIKLFDSPEDAKQYVKETFRGTDYMWLEKGDRISGHFESWRRLYVEIERVEVLE